MALIDSWIMEAAEQKHLLFLNTDASDLSRFTAGYVAWVDEDWIGLRLVGTSGDFDGFMAVRSNHVVRVKRGGTYYECLANSAPSNSLPDFSVSCFDDMLDQLKQMQTVVWIHDSYYITKGVFVNHDYECVEITEYSSNLISMGHAVVSLSDIVKIEFGGPDQSLLSKLVSSKPAL